jgi:hypothetical protein
LGENGVQDRVRDLVGHLVDGLQRRIPR